MRYKYSVPTGIRNAVEWHLEHYPEDKRQLEQYKREMIPSPTQSYSLTAGVDGGEAHRSTEEVALRIASAQYVRMLEITCTAVEKALKAEDEIGRKLVSLVYWRKEYTIEGAGLKLHVSKSSAYRKINKIISRVAYEIGYVSI